MIDMETPAYTDRQAGNIVANIERVFATGNVELLKGPAYRFLNLYIPGMIAHYDLDGFRNYYSRVELLGEDILSCGQVGWSTEDWADELDRRGDARYFIVAEMLRKTVAIAK